jgi:hypothetical protein
MSVNKPSSANQPKPDSGSKPASTATQRVVESTKQSVHNALNKK